MKLYKHSGLPEEYQNKGYNCVAQEWEKGSLKGREQSGEFGLTSDQRVERSFEEKCSERIEKCKRHNTNLYRELSSYTPLSSRSKRARFMIFRLSVLCSASASASASSALPF
ncbi:hypothetical protein RJT34_15855 [Clitoria ternatea]|uniref:Uncharacterized protein n=1 Tax=Clitoria ternatea TaxID=43366 RepID=A0AAN9J672_CLITE